MEQVDERILRSIKSIVLNSAHETSESALLPSTIIDCTGDQLVVVRQGAFPADLLIKAFN
jgi:tRNA A37 threonylcarbamoyladenosine synthetase subunit TsaC/SUA5/YrdC